MAWAAGLSLLSGSIASATVVLAPGGSGFPTGNSAGFDQTQPYETLVTTIDSPVETKTITVGVQYDLKFYIETRIYRDTQFSPTGTLDFIYQVHNVSDDNEITTFGDSIARLTLQSFAGFAVSGDYTPSTGSSPSGPDVAPVSLDRTGTAGAVVGFNFAGNDSTGTFQSTTLIPNSFSDFLVVRTDASSYTTGTASVQGGLGESSPAPVPLGLSGVPEPTSLSAIAVAGTMLLGRRRRISR